jgi:hypothetical protein
VQDYSIIKSSFWVGPIGKKIRALKDKDARILAMYLLSNPHKSILGLYYLPIPSIVHETELTEAETRKAFKKLQRIGFAFWDEATEYVFIPGMLNDNIGNSLKPTDGRMKKYQEAFASIPFDVKFKKSLFQQYGSGYSWAYNNDGGVEAPSPAPPRGASPGGREGALTQNETLQTLQIKNEKKTNMGSQLVDNFSPESIAPAIDIKGEPEKTAPAHVGDKSQAKTEPERPQTSEDAQKRPENELAGHDTLNPKERILGPFKAIPENSPSTPRTRARPKIKNKRAKYTTLAYGQFRIASSALVRDRAGYEAYDKSAIGILDTLVMRNGLEETLAFLDLWHDAGKSWSRFASGEPNAAGSRLSPAFHVRGMTPAIQDVMRDDPDFKILVKKYGFILGTDPESTVKNLAEAGIQINGFLKKAVASGN